MILTYFRPNMRGNVENKNNSVNIRLVTKTPDIRNFLRTSHLMSYWNIRSGNTGINDPELLGKYRSGRSWTAPLSRHKHVKLFKPFTPHAKPFTPHVIAWSVRKSVDS